MALVLGLGLDHRVKIGQNVVKVVGINLPKSVQLEVAGGKSFRITDEERTEILPKVFVSLGLNRPSDTHFFCRLAFEAPRSIPIERLDQKSPRVCDEPGSSAIRR